MHTTGICKLKLVSILVTLVIILLSTAYAAVTCNSTHNPCEELIYKGSKCKDGFCTNPFQSGCLNSIIESSDSRSSEIEEVLRRYLLSSPRTCNSDDSPDAAERGICKERSEYTEVRLWAQNVSGLSSSQQLYLLWGLFLL